MKLNKTRYFACDQCGTMLDAQEDRTFKVLAALPGPGVFGILQFCCPKCAEKFAKAHSEDGAMGALPMMMIADAECIPDLEKHAFVQAVEVENLEEAMESGCEKEPEPWASELDYYDSDFDPDEDEEQEDDY